MSSQTVSAFDPRPRTCAFQLVRGWIAAATATTFIALAFVPGSAGAVEPWPHVDEPPKGGVQWVARSMIVNGVPTSVMQFQSPLTAADITDYYKTKWSSGYDHPPSIHHIGDATVIGQMKGSYLMTVKVTANANGGSQGLISVAQVLGNKPDRDPGIVPLIGGAHVVSVVEAEDGGQHSRQVMIMATQSPEAVADYYTQTLTDSGWHKLQGNVSIPPAGASLPVGSFLAFSRDGQEIQLSIAGSAKGHGTSVMANVVSRAAGTSE